MNAPPPDVMSMFCAEKKKNGEGKEKRPNTNKCLLSESAPFINKLFQKPHTGLFPTPWPDLIAWMPIIWKGFVKLVMFIEALFHTEESWSSFCSEGEDEFWDRQVAMPATNHLPNMLTPIYGALELGKKRFYDLRSFRGKKCCFSFPRKIWK